MDITVVCVDDVDPLEADRVVRLSADRLKARKSLLLTSHVRPSNAKVEWTKIKPIRDVYSYSCFILEKLKDYVDTSHVLVVQKDGYVINAKAWTDEFLKYDYIGAPWYGYSTLGVAEGAVGNGGFSLRSKDFLEAGARVLKEARIKKLPVLEKTQGEDNFLCVQNYNKMVNLGIKFAPTYLANKFSTEFGYNNYVPYLDQLGFHGHLSRETVPCDLL